MADAPRYRTLVETKEYQAQLDELAVRFGEEILDRALAGILWGIANNAEGYDRVTWNIRVAKSRAFDALSQPSFRIFFGIERLNEQASTSTESSRQHGRRKVQQRSQQGPDRLQGGPTES